MVWRVWFALALGGCAISFASRPWPPDAPARETTLGLSISTVTLPNGLRVVVVRDPKASEVQVTTRYGVGAVDDADHPGIAHLVEHLMFQQILDGQPLFSHLEDDASYFNAATTYDATTYVTRAPAAALDELISIEALRLEQRCATITDAAFAHEREVVENELRQRDRSSEIFEAIHRALYPEGHPYHRSVGGTVETVRATTRTQACSFVDAYYAPANAVLVLSGNLGKPEIDRSLAALGAHVTRRGGATPTRIAPAQLRPVQLEVSVPIDEDMLVLAWPLPTELALQAKVRAIEAALPRLVDAQIKGSVVAIEFGDQRAPMLGLAVLPGDGETFLAAGAGTRRGVEGLPTTIYRKGGDQGVDDAAFERIKQGAIYSTYATLEDGGDRDARLASYVLAGHDPRVALETELGALRSMSHDDSYQLVMQYLNANTPTVVTLKANAGKKRGEKATMRAAIHDMGPRRASVDPGLARRPAEHVPAHAPDVRTHVLSNGLKIVLLPDSSVATFDARIVFGAGTADEPADRRGVALLAAHTLTWDLHYIHDLIAFIGAGGMRNTDVSTDRTSFSVQGLDQHLDVVLAGLRRWVREGTYDDTAATYLHALRHVTKGADDQGPLTDAWRTALFGMNHPYVDAGLARHINNSLTLDDAARFRASHYTPDNATLVIAGHFDPAVAERWIEFLFDDWSGHAAPRASIPAAGRPTAIAKIDDLALVQLRIALPAASGRAEALVIAEMLDEIAHDVRYSLGASYTFGAQLGETRLARFYVVAGWVDAPRAASSVQLVRDRIHELRSDSTAAMRAFVIARRHVLTALRSHAGSASALASAVETDLELGRSPISDARTAADVERLTFDRVVPALDELDLPRATVLMDGPAAEIQHAFDVLGRKPQYIDSPPPSVGAGPGAIPTEVSTAEQNVPLRDLVPSLTDRPPSRLMWMIAPQAVGASVDASSELFTGYGIGAAIAYRITWPNAIGIHVDAANLQTSDSSAVVPLEVAAMFHWDSGTQAWGELMFGLHADRATLPGVAPAWEYAPYYAIQGGYDVLHIGNQRLGFCAGYQHTVDSAIGYSAVSISFAVRR